MIKGRTHQMDRVKSVLCASVTLSLLNGLPTFLAVPALAQQASATLVAQSEVSREVARATFVSAATLAAIQRQSDADLRRQRFEIEELRAEVDELRTSGAADAAALTELRDTLAQREAAFVVELAEKDRAFAEEIAAYRRAVEDIAATPEGLAALARFNDGDEAGALVVLDRLRSVRDLAAARRIAQLALDARNRAAEGVSTQDVIARYSEVTNADPQAFYDWIILSGLIKDSGDLTKALATARHAEKNASNQRERLVALRTIGNLQSSLGNLADALQTFRSGFMIAELLAAEDTKDLELQDSLASFATNIGDMQVDLGELPAAQESYQRSLEISQELARLDPNNSSFQISLARSLARLARVQIALGDLSKSFGNLGQSLGIYQRLSVSDPENIQLQETLSMAMERFGDLKMDRDDLTGALEVYGRSLVIRERLAAADPGNAARLHLLPRSLDRIGDVQIAQGDLAGAVKSYARSLLIVERLASIDPKNTQWQRDLSVALMKLGDAQMAQKNFPGALESYLRSQRIQERLLTVDPQNASWEHDLSQSLARVSDVQFALGDEPAAISSYRRALAILERLVAADPGNTRWQRDVWLALRAIRRFPNSGVSWEDVVKKMEQMVANGTFLLEDRYYLEEARTEAAKEAP